MDQSPGKEPDQANRSDIEFGVYAGPKVESRRKFKPWIIVSSSAAVTLILVLVGFSLIRVFGGSKAPTTSGRGEDLKSFGGALPSFESVGRSADPTENMPPTDAKEIKTSQGILKIERVRITNEFSECPQGGGSCTEARGNKYLLIVTLKSVEGRNTQDFHDKVAVDAFDSYVKTSDGQTLNVSQVGGVPPNDSTDITFSYLYASNREGIIFHWPGNPPIRLQTTI